MQFNTFVSSGRDLERCAQAPGLNEVLLEPQLLSRQGELGEGATFSLAAEARRLGLRPVLVWDALMPERLMVPICERLCQWNLHCFAAIRVCDPGAAQWLIGQRPEMPLQLIVETGNHNRVALQGWCDIFAGSLERLVLSIELPESQLVDYCRQLPVACELLGIGPILLFYSPRSLLANPLPDTSPPDRTSMSSPADRSILTDLAGPNQDCHDRPNPNRDRPVAQPLRATVTSEATHYRPFPVLETSHGSFMFLDKDQFILDRLDALRAAGLHSVRLDLRHVSQAGDRATNIDDICRCIAADPVALRARWPRPTQAPFFNANRTTALFPRMQSKLMAYRNEACLAEILAGVKGQYVVFHALRSFEISQIQAIMLPTGERIVLPDGLQLLDLQGDAIASCTVDQILIASWIKKATPGALLLSVMVNG